jgi:ATP-dependent DNA helicase
VKVSDANGPGVGDWLTDRLRAWGIDTLTDVQVLALREGIADGKSMVVSAPTSSGKTLVGEIAVLAALRAGVRAIYLVSHKALADQKYLDFDTRFGERSTEPIGSVGLNTGDRAEGDIDAQLVVATYEKALGLILTEQLNPTNALIVADELQIVGEPNRGPDIEALCAVIRQAGCKQFVALTATVENPEDLAGWMNCELVRSFQRDVPLHQEIWHSNRAYRVTFGQADGEETPLARVQCDDVISVVGRLLEMERGPVLVFTESRRESATLAATFGKGRPRAGQGIVIAEQLDLFSEPTESSEQLRENAERRIAFHTADLSPQEKQVIETGFLGSHFDVCFATSTLAAGVNFPFRSVVFYKLTFQYGDRQGSHLPRTDYRNMSGRAGRLGMHPDGYAILLPRNRVELAHANHLVLPDNDRLESQLISLSLRKSLLMLVASRLAGNFDEVMGFFRNTLYWYQTLDRNPKKLATLETESHAAIRWLVANRLFSDADGTLLITPFGHGVALSGLLPATGMQFAAMLQKSKPELERSFEDWIPGLIYAVCASQEFCADRPSRYLPYPTRTLHDSVTFWSTKKLPVPLDRANTRLAQCAHAMALYVDGVPERKIAFATQVTSGAIHRLATDVAWVLDGLHRISCVPELECTQFTSNQIAMLARRARWGAPAEALDVIRVAERHNVPGFGRQRAMALIAQGIQTLHDVLATTKDKLVQLLRNDRRAQALLDAVSDTVGYAPSRLAASHVRTAKALGIEKLVDACNRELGVEYDHAIASLLDIETSWILTVLDNGQRQNVPDMLVQLGERRVLIECKTCNKSPPLIKKEEAWAVMQKSADFDKSMHRVTLGKPRFDETSKKKAAASHDITLVEHDVFVEGLLRVHGGSLGPADFLNWLSVAGVAEIERLGGTPTFNT